MLVQHYIEPLFSNNFSGLTLLILEMIFIPGLTEEAGKMLGTLPALKKYKPVYTTDYILLFGASGLGFALTESCLDLWNSSASIVSEITAVIYRGIYPFHMYMQFIMGIFWAPAVSAKSKGKTGLCRMYYVFSLLIPLLLHALHDFITSIDELFPSSYVFLMVFLVFEAIVVTVAIYKIIKKISLNQSNQAEVE